MMDSQENALLQQSTLDPAKKAYATKQEVLERVKEIAHSAEVPNKEELDMLKTIFYKIHLAERDAQTKEYLAAGGDPEKYVLLPDDTEEAFKAEMQIIKEKRAKIFLQQEEEKQENLAKKLEIIEKIKAMTTSPEEANKSYQEFKTLQQEWKEIKAIPADKAKSAANTSSSAYKTGCRCVGKPEWPPPRRSAGEIRTQSWPFPSGNGSAEGSPRSAPAPSGRRASDWPLRRFAAPCVPDSYGTFCPYRHLPDSNSFLL